MLGRQAKVLTEPQVRSVQAYLASSSAPLRNQVIFLLSLRAGLRAKEIAGLTWSMVTDAEGEITDTIRLVDAASKGDSGGVIPLATELRKKLLALKDERGAVNAGDKVIATRKREGPSPQVIVNMFAGWYRDLGFDGCSSHSGRRTFITRAARNIGRFGGSLRDVQALARHSSLSMTQRYIDVDTAAMRKVVDA